MDKMVITGNGIPLRGDVKIQGAKNAALPIIFATLLAKGVHQLQNVPRLQDVFSAIKLLEGIGAKATFIDHQLEIDTREVHSQQAPYDLVRTMRASCLMLGPLLAHYGKAQVSMPGGCAIGVRPIDLHLKAFEKLGAKIEVKNGEVLASVDQARRLRGDHFIFETVTVTGTENAIMAAVLSEGQTILENAAKEPEVINLCEILNDAGAKIEGVGSARLTIYGVQSIHPLRGSIIPDRIEAGTYIMAGLISKGEIIIHQMDVKHLESVLDKLKEMGAQFEILNDHTLKISRSELKPFKIVTAPYPGIPTDLQAQFMALSLIIDGTSIIEETIFENRFMHVSELMRMGADISIKGNTAIINGGKKLGGATVMATDLRASASLILAGLVASGETTVRRIYHLDRGYEAIEKRLSHMGAHIKREFDV